MDSTDHWRQLQQRLLQFAEARDWRQFHSPKNLAMALSGEAGELLEHFQWLSQTQSRQLDAEKRRLVALELADIQIYLIRLAQELQVDLLAAVDEKMGINETRYPVERVRGDARRASDYPDLPESSG
jgi:dCTP diphosphatase